MLGAFSTKAIIILPQKECFYAYCGHWSSVTDCRQIGYNDNDKCKQRGDPASNGALLANAFSSGIGVMVSIFQLIFPWRAFKKIKMLSTTVTRNILPKIKDFFFGGDPGNWGIFWGPYEPSSKCGHGCLGQVAYQNISIFMSQDLWRFSEPIDLWYPWQWSYLWGYLCLQYLLLFLPSSLVQVKP